VQHRVRLARRQEDLVDRARIGRRTRSFRNERHVAAAVRRDCDGVLQDQEQGSDDVDYIFDVAVEVAKSLTGFRHDEDLVDGGSFEVLG
jgi:hypothetical protein